MPQATVKLYDSLTKTGVLIADDAETTYEIDEDVMDSSPMFRFLRPGQRVTFDLVPDGAKERVRNIRIGIS
jgi:cold shock CspA family protein